MKDTVGFGSLLTDGVTETSVRTVTMQRYAQLPMIANDQKWRSLVKAVGVDFDPEAADLGAQLQLFAKKIRSKNSGKAGGRPRKLSSEAEYWIIKFAEDMQKARGISCRQACITALKELSEDPDSRKALEIWLEEPLKREPGVRRKKQFETLGKRLQNLIDARNSHLKKLQERGGLASVFREKSQG